MFPFPRRMILGVTGGIAAYKSCELLRRLMDRGIEVTVVPTENALRFVGTATWEALTGKPVQSSLWSDVSSGAHIELARDAQLLVIAPATADFIARLAHGRSEDLLGATALTMQAPIVVIPAMHHQMWRNPATVANVATLRSRGILVMEPAEGPLNNGDSGVGRFPETFEILDFLQQSGFLRSDLVGKHVVVTAGGTREMIDPVRFIGNRSSGKQGIALAKAAASRGARVSLIAANVGEDLLPNDQSITLTKVESALQLANTLSKIESFDILLMTAAVADYRPVTASVTKLKRDGSDRSLELIENPDVLAGFARNYRNSGGSGAGIIVGFAAESEVNLTSAAEKLARKAVDYLFVNDVSAYPVFDSDSNGGVLLRADGARKDFGYQSKETLSDVLLDELVKGLG